MMRLLPMLLLCFALSTLIYECAFAVGKITVDPNASGSAASKAPVISDARLAQKVTYEARYVPVQHILQDLSEMTKIELYAGSNKNDWPVRSRKMNIFVKDVKMADLMNSIAHAMKFKWSRNDDVNPPTYRLVVDGKVAAAADAQKAQGDAQSEELWCKSRKQWLDIIMSYNDSELPLIKEADPTLYRYARTGTVSAIRALFEDIPETKNAFLAGKSFRISTYMLSEHTHSLLYSAANEFGKFLQIILKQEPTGFGDSFKSNESVDICFNRTDIQYFTPNLRYGMFTMEDTGYFHIDKDGKDFEITSFKNKNTDWALAQAECENKILDGLSDFSTIKAELYSKLPKQQIHMKKQEELWYPNEPLNEHFDFPELEKAIKLKIETPKAKQNPVLDINNYIASFQKALADATGLGVVSDSWVNIEGDKLLDQEAKLSELLDKFSTQFNYNWDKPSSILEFRHRKWWKNRLNQIPDEWVAAWSENTKKNGNLSLDDLARISELTYGQAEECIKADKVIGKAGVYQQMLNILDDNLQWLRLYSALNSQQRTYLADRWISGAMLTPDQWKLAQVMFDRIGSLRSDALFSLKNATDNALRYEFREFEVTNQDGDNAANEDRKWKITLPKYTPPATPEKKTD